MPTYTTMNLPKPTDFEEFQRICRDVLVKQYNMEFTINGRIGQAQNGIDIVSCDGTIVAQCKAYNNSTHQSFVKEITQDYNNACNSTYKFNQFIAMTTLNYDAPSIKELSKAGTIVFFFWEDIQSLILSNDALFRLHYPTYIPYLQELNQKSRDKAFVERFIDMCSKHEIENILSSFTYNGYFPDSYLDVSDDIENELNTLIHSQEATYVSKDLLSDCYLFLNDFTYYTQQIRLLMKPIVNTDSVSSIVCPYRQPTESEKEELDCIQRRMIDIYKKYRWWE